MDTRLIAVGAALAGLLIGGSAWAFSAGYGEDGLSNLELRLAGLGPTSTRAHEQVFGFGIDQAIANPLFPDSAVDSQALASIRLIGVVRTPNRTGAWLSIGSASPEWYGVGEDKEGYALQSVTSGGVTLMTPEGEKQFQMAAAPPKPASSSTSPAGAPGQTEAR